MSAFRKPTPVEIELLRLIASEDGRMSHDDKRLGPYCDETSTLTAPDIFNVCHDLDWLHTVHNCFTDELTASITARGRAALEAA